MSRAICLFVVKNGRIARDITNILHSNARPWRSCCLSSLVNVSIDLPVLTEQRPNLSRHCQVLFVNVGDSLERFACFDRAASKSLETLPNIDTTVRLFLTKNSQSVRDITKHIRTLVCMVFVKIRNVSNQIVVWYTTLSNVSALVPFLRGGNRLATYAGL